MRDTERVMDFDIDNVGVSGGIADDAEGEAEANTATGEDNESDARLDKDAIATVGEGVNRACRNMTYSHTSIR